MLSEIFSCLFIVYAIICARLVRGRLLKQVTLSNVGPVDEQNPPGVNVTAVGVDVFVVGAALRCYRDISMSFASHVCILFIISCFVSLIRCRVCCPSHLLIFFQNRCSGYKFFKAVNKIRNTLKLKNKHVFSKLACLSSYFVCGSLLLSVDISCTYNNVTGH